MPKLRTALRRAGFLLAMIYVAGRVGAADAAGAATAARDVETHYADLAEAIYGDALHQAKALQDRIDAFLSDPSPSTLDTARTQWKQARIPYLQSEGFRFGSATVDEWEPRVNAWPLDEGLIDYVGTSYGTHSDDNPLYTLNVIATRQLRIGARMVDAHSIDEKLLREMQQAEGVQTNVSTGYHAIEFLLWGQPVRGHGPGIGQRPATDYDLAHCSHGNCDRRAAYLKTAAQLLVDDLAQMVADWGTNGKARRELLDKGEQGGLSQILTGLGSLTFGEMAGERMKLGLELHDPEEAQDCFSDNTHNSHYYDEVGIADLWSGRYVASDGRVVAGVSIRDYVMARDPAAARGVDTAIANALSKIKIIKDAADSGRMGYDQMIAAGNPEGNRLVQDAMDALVAQTRAIEAVAATLKLQVASNKSDHSSDTMLH
ncbi:MAG TPA: imelysin family protein [Rhizomicrobium sp.]|nr:imelysin family protein [Rhizomicrobium sp.]